MRTQNPLIRHMVLLLTLTVCWSASAADWPNWRGPNYNGISDETGWLTSWPEKGPNVLWKASLGIGFSSIAVSDGKAYAMGNINKKTDVVYCFNAESGEELWRHSYAQRLDPKYYEGGTLASPTVDGGRVYTLSKDGKVFCLDAKTGKVKWEKDLIKELEIQRTGWGLAGSPLVVGDLVILNAGRRGLALNKKDGAIVWRNEKEAGGYATAVPFVSGGKRCVAMFGFREVLGLVAATGKELWRHNWRTKHDVNAGDPIIVGDKVYISSGYGNGCALLKISGNEVTELWRNKNMRNKMNGSVLFEGSIYGVDEKGELRCLNLDSGEVVWAQAGFKQGSVTIADGKLIVMGASGNLVVAEATASGYKPLAEAKVLSGRCWTVPVLANGRIYVRNAAGDMVCLDVKGSGASACGGNEWTNFRGPNRDGKSPETGLLKSWPEGGPPLAWKATGLGKGFSGVSIAGGKIFTMGDRDGQQFVIALDRSTRKELWAAKIGEQWKTGKAGPRCTPTIDGNLVYAIGTRGDLICVKACSGEVQWRKNFGEDFGGKMMSKWAYSESPLVDGDKLVCTPGAKDAMIVALNKKTGETIWKAAVPDLGERGKDGAGYASIVVGNCCGIRQYIQMAGRGVISVAADDGRFLWGYNKVANDVANIANVLVDGDYVFCTTSYKTGSALLKLSPAGGGIKAEEVYFLTPDEFENHHGGVVLLDGYIYGGDGQNKGRLACVEMKTGKVLWKEPPLGKGSAALVYADGRLYYRYQNGLMTLVEATTEKLNVKGSFMLPDPEKYSWPHPVIVDKKLYVRDNDVLLCYDIAAGS